MIDKRLVNKLFSIHSMSGEEEKIAKFICSYLDDIGVSYKTDEIGNIYNFEHRGKPMLSAHTDTVQSDFDKDLTKFIKIHGDILSGYGVIGGDDKCGIYIILKLLEDGEKFNFVLPASEEVGGVGSDYFMTSHGDLVTDTPYALVLDRKGSSDIIGFKNDYCEMDFQNVLERVGKQFGFSENMGTFSDADAFSKATASANLSVGYYNPHTKYEYVKLSEMANTMNFVHAMIKNVDETFNVPRKRKYKDIKRYYPNWEDDYYDIYSPFNEGDRDNSSTKFTQCAGCHEYVETEKMVFIETLNSHLCDTCFYNLQSELIYDDINYGL